MKARLANVASVALLFAVFLYTYRTLIAPTYDYYGMGWRNPPMSMLILSLLMNLTIAFAIRPSYMQPSQLFLVVQFLVVFLPASIVCLNVTLPELDPARAMSLVVVMFLGLLAQVMLNPRSAHSKRAPGTRYPARTVRRMFIGLFVFACVVLGATLYSLGNLFTISDFSSMYEQRDLLDDYSVGAPLRYSISWVVMFVLPALMVASFELRGARRRALFAFCLVGYFILFGITATKTTLFGPIIVLAIRHGLKQGRVSYVQKFAIACSVLLAFPLVFAMFESLEIFSTLYVSIVNFRIFSVPQTLYIQYLDFFSTHPHTYGSHISVVSWLVAYPFDAQTFLLIGEYFYPGSNMTANAGTWAQDGIAAFGMPGIFVVSLLFAAVTRLLDVASDGQDPRKVGAAVCMLSLFISNASIFTTLLTGGLGIAIALLVLARSDRVPRRARVAFLAGSCSTRPFVT